jgi:(p)ppGpp synthase/HD superfamily hydrolase
VAELGIAAPAQGAAHAIDPRELEELTGQVKWLQSLREWQTEFVGQLTPREFVDTITDDLLGARIFAFTPKGEALSLPKGATVVDYAYHIHTDVGNCMVRRRAPVARRQSQIHPSICP